MGRRERQTGLTSLLLLLAPSCFWAALHVPNRCLSEVVPAESDVLPDRAVFVYPPGQYSRLGREYTVDWAYRH